MKAKLMAVFCILAAVVVLVGCNKKDAVKADVAVQRAASMQAVYDAVYNPGDLSDQEKKAIAEEACIKAVQKIIDQKKEVLKTASLVDYKKELFSNVDQKDLSRIQVMMTSGPSFEYITTPLEAVFELNGSKYRLSGTVRHFLLKNKKKTHMIEEEGLTYELMT